jgi:hypothetical protein
MFAYPFSAGADLMRRNIETQLSLLVSLSGGVLHTTMQLGELNRQTGRRLLEESAADMQKAFQLRSPADLQSFIGEQSQMSVEKMRGYWQNVQNIAAENWIEAQQVAASTVAPASAEPEQAGADTRTENASADSTHKPPHKVDVQPSPLVEKLVDSVAVDIDKPDARM